MCLRSGSLCDVSQRAHLTFPAELLLDRDAVVVQRERVVSPVAERSQLARDVVNACEQRHRSRNDHSLDWRQMMNLNVVVMLMVLHQLSADAVDQVVHHPVGSGAHAVVVLHHRRRLVRVERSGVASRLEAQELPRLVLVHLHDDLEQLEHHVFGRAALIDLHREVDSDVHRVQVNVAPLEVLPARVVGEELDVDLHPVLEPLRVLLCRDLPVGLEHDVVVDDPAGIGGFHNSYPWYANPFARVASVCLSSCVLRLCCHQHPSSPPAQRSCYSTNSSQHFSRRSLGDHIPCQILFWPHRLHRALMCFWYSARVRAIRMPSSCGGVPPRGSRAPVVSASVP
jgi:hypothetical protein